MEPEELRSDSGASQLAAEESMPQQKIHAGFTGGAELSQPVVVPGLLVDG
jgi:hypothetical protein